MLASIIVKELVIGDIIVKGLADEVADTIIEVDDHNKGFGNMIVKKISDVVVYNMP